MSWNYRQAEILKPNKEKYYAIIEAYYDEKDNINSWAKLPPMEFEDMEDLKWNINVIKESLEKPLVKFYMDEDEELKLINE